MHSINPICCCRIANNFHVSDSTGMTSDEEDLPKITFGSFSQSQACKREPGQQPPAVNSFAVVRLVNPGSPATDHKILIRDKGIGVRLMVTEMQLGTVTETLLEVDPFAGMVKDHALPVLDWEIQCTIWYVIV